MDENIEIDSQIKPGIRAITYTKGADPKIKRKKQKVRTRKITNDELDKGLKKNSTKTDVIHSVKNLDESPKGTPKKNIRVRKYGNNTAVITRKKTNDKPLNKSAYNMIKLKPAKFEVNEPLDSIPLKKKESKIYNSSIEYDMSLTKDKWGSQELKNITENKGSIQLDDGNINILYPTTIENKIDNINIYNEIKQPITIQNTYIENLVQNNLLYSNNQYSQQPDYIYNNNYHSYNFIPKASLETNNIKDVNSIYTNINDNIANDAINSMKTINTITDNNPNTNNSFKKFNWIKNITTINPISNNNPINNINNINATTNNNIITSINYNTLPLQTDINIIKSIYSYNYPKSQKTENDKIQYYKSKLLKGQFHKNFCSRKSNNFFHRYNVVQSPQLLYQNKTRINGYSVKGSTGPKMSSLLNDPKEPPEKFNLTEFEVIRLIGQGGFSYIFMVRWKKNGKNYALKKCLSQKEEDFKIERQQAKVIMDFVNSTQCDGVVKIYGEIINKQNYTQYILMELAGIDWEKEIKYRQKTGKYYSENDIMKIIDQLVKTCALLEKYSISHRDLKPENVLISKDGKYKLCDFSDSVVCHKGKTKQLVRGTEIFMSPLVASAYHNRDYAYHDCFKSDVFSLGLCILNAVTYSSKYLLEFKTLKENSKIAYLTRVLGNRFSQKFIKLLFWMLQYDETKRPYFGQLLKVLATY